MDKYKDYSNERRNYYNSDIIEILDFERKYIVEHLNQWIFDNIENFLYKNPIELLNEAVKMIQEEKV